MACAGHSDAQAPQAWQAADFMSSLQAGTRIGREEAAAKASMETAARDGREGNDGERNDTEREQS